jgi:hypothetical protein
MQKNLAAAPHTSGVPESMSPFLFEFAPPDRFRVWKFGHAMPQEHHVHVPTAKRCVSQDPARVGGRLRLLLGGRAGTRRLKTRFGKETGIAADVVF